MAQFKLPLSGNVSQWINPMTWFMSGDTLNVYLGDSSAPEIETEILDRVGTYGRQLGQLTDALVVMLRHMPDRAHWPADEQATIQKFEAMAAAVAAIKEKHQRPAVRPDLTPAAPSPSSPPPR